MFSKNRSVPFRTDLFLLVHDLWKAWSLRELFPLTCCAPQRTTTPSRSEASNPGFAAFAVDRDLHMCGHIAMQLHWHVELTQALEGIVQMYLPTIDFEPLRFERRRDVRRCD